MKLLLNWLLSLLIAAFFVWLSSRQWPVSILLCDDLALDQATLVCSAADETGRAFVSWSVNFLWLLPAFGILVAVHFLRVIRWEPLVQPLARFDFWTLNRVGAISFLALFLFPLRLGELARPYLIAQTGKLRKSAAFGTIAVERVIDGLMMALLLALVLLFLPSTERTVYLSLNAGAAISIVAFSAALVLLIIAWLSRRLAVSLVHRFLGLFSRRLAVRLSGMMDAFIDGMKAMPSLSHCARFLLLTLVYWGINGFYYYFVALAFGLDSTLDLTAAYAMMAAVAVGMMIPNSPANVGSFWYFLLLPLELYPAPSHPGAPMAFALTVWGLMLLQYALFAGWYLFSGRFSLASLWSIQRQKLEGDAQ